MSTTIITLTKNPNSECDCEEYCARWGKAEDGSYEFWCPLVPKGFIEYGIDCKLYLRKDESMKQTIITKDKR